jgi:hypothetical protein
MASNRRAYLFGVEVFALNFAAVQHILGERFQNGFLPEEWPTARPESTVRLHTRERRQGYRTRALFVSSIVRRRKFKSSPSRDYAGSLHAQGSHGIYGCGSVGRKKCGGQRDYGDANQRNKNCQRVASAVHLPQWVRQFLLTIPLLMPDGVEGRARQVSDCAHQCCVFHFARNFHRSAQEYVE